jgi:hypothetical protein
MKVGLIFVTPEGLEALAHSIRVLGGKGARLEVHQDEDTHGAIRLCCTKESGWINLGNDC